MALPCLLAAMLGSARAEDRSHIFVPEANAFVKLSDQTRLFLLGDLTRNVTESLTDVELGAYLDLTLKPILRRRLHDANWERERYLWVRVGYLWARGVGRDDAFTEHRVSVSVTGRVELPHAVWLVQRAQADLRDVDDDFSKRYRYRLGFEREFDVGGTVMVPYAQAEAFYDTRFDSWNRELYQVGVEIGLTKAWRFEPYFSRQHDSRSASGNVDTIGFVLKYYR